MPTRSLHKPRIPRNEPNRQPAHFESARPDTCRPAGFGRVRTTKTHVRTTISHYYTASPPCRRATHFNASIGHNTRLETARQTSQSSTLSGEVPNAACKNGT